MKKRILSLGLLVVVLLGVIAFPACGEKKPHEPPLETVTVYGEFYTIKEACNQGYLTIDDINYIYENEIKPNVFEPLEESQKEKILHDYELTHSPVSNQLEIKSYGNYHGFPVVLIQDIYYENWLQKTFLPYSAGGGVFYYTDLALMRIWKESETPIKVEKPKNPYGAFYSLEKAYEHGFLTREELLQLSRDSVALDSELESQILHDYQLLDMEKSEITGFDCLGNFNGCTVIRIYDILYLDVWMMTYNCTIDGINFSSTIPLINVWRPLNE